MHVTIRFNYTHVFSVCCYDGMISLNLFKIGTFDVGTERVNLLFDLLESDR